MQRKHMPGCECCGGCVPCSLPISGFLYEVLTDGCGFCNYTDNIPRPEVVDTDYIGGVLRVTHDNVTSFSIGQDVIIDGVTYTIDQVDVDDNAFIVDAPSDPGIAVGEEIILVPDRLSFTGQQCDRYKRFPAAYSVGTPLTTLINVEWWQTVSSKWCDNTPTTCIGLVCTCCDCEAPDPGVADPCQVANNADCPSNECDGSIWLSNRGWVKPTGCDPGDIATTQSDWDTSYNTGAVIAQRWTPITIVWVTVEVKAAEVKVTIENELFVFESLEVCSQISNLHEDLTYTCEATRCECSDPETDPYSIIVLHETTYTWSVAWSCSYTTALMDITLQMVGIDGSENVCGFPAELVSGDPQTIPAGNVNPLDIYCGHKYSTFSNGNKMNGAVYRRLVPVQQKTIPVDWCELQYAPAVVTFSEGDTLDFDVELFQFGIAEEPTLRVPQLSASNNGIGCNVYGCGGGRPPDYVAGCEGSPGTPGSILLLSAVGDTTFAPGYNGCNWPACSQLNMFDCNSNYAMKAPTFRMSQFLDGYQYASYDASGTIPQCLVDEVSVTLIELA